DAPLAGVKAPEGQDVASGCGSSVAARRWGEGVGQSVGGLVAPGIQGGPRHLMRAAQLGHDTVIALMCQPSGCPFGPHLGRARMTLTHWVLPRVVVVVGASTIPRGSLSVYRRSQSVKLVSPI